METLLIELTPIMTIALEVIAGKYGNGAERIKNLQDKGYDYKLIQSCVNDLVAIMEKY